MGVWWDMDWSKRVKLTVSNPRTDLRVLVKITAARIPYANFKAGGDDLRFVASDQVTELDYEIERWDAAGNSWVWVKVPDGATEFYLYASNPSATAASDPDATFDGDYRAVWHLKDAAAGPYTDATASNDLTAWQPAYNQSVDGAVGKQIRFHTGTAGQHGSGYKATTTNLNHFPVTFDFWLEIADLGTEGRIVIEKYLAYQISLNASRKLVFSFTNGASVVTIVTSTAVIQYDTRYHVHVTFENVAGFGTGKIYIDGALDASNTMGSSFSAPAANQTIFIARNVAGAYGYLDGSLDEFRVHSVSRDVNWIEADHDSQSDTLLVWGAVETAPEHWLEFIIAGVNRTKYVVPGTFEINDHYNSRKTGRFNMVDLTNYRRDAVVPYIPVVGNSIQIKYDGVKIFEGNIARVKRHVPMKNSAMFFEVEFVDYTWLCDKRLVARIYEEQLAGDIVKDIVAKDLTSESITTTYVSNGVSVYRCVFPYVTATEAISDLAKMSAYNWEIDYDKNLRFYDPSTNPSPFDLFQGSGNYRNVHVIQHRELYRNVQYVRGGEDITDLQQEEFHGDGTTRSFQTVYKVASEPIVYVNGIQQIIGVRGTNEGFAQWYFQKGEKELTIDADGTAPAIGDLIVVYYYGLFPVFIQKTTPGEISARASAEGGSGRYEDMEEDYSIESFDHAEQKADMLLRKYGIFADLTEIDYQTDAGGLKSGMVQDITLPEFQFTDTVLIDSVRTFDLQSGVQGPILRYDIKAVGGEHIGGWHEFFKQMAAYERKSIRETETLSLLLDFDEEVILAETFTTADPLIDDADDTWSIWTVGYSSVGYTFNGKDSDRVAHLEGVGNMEVG